MGSSRRHKEKRDTERRSRSRSKSRSRSRSASKSRSRSDREKHSKRHHSKHHKSVYSKERRKRAHSSSEEDERIASSSQPSKEKKPKVKECKSPQQSDYSSSSHQLTTVCVKTEPEDDYNVKAEKSVERGKQQSRKDEHRSDNSGEPSVASSGNEISMSIEETNKLREKLGLKPLQVDGKDEGDASKSEPTKEVFVKTENISEKQKIEKTKERLQIMREKRKINEKLRNVKGLAADDEEDDALGWVEKSRRIQEEKLKAEKKAKMLEEMDNEFGVDTLISGEEAKRRDNLYNTSHLSGLTVAHSETAFKEGNVVVLTLKDKEVLDENEDVLENVNIVDEEKLKKNLENKTKKPEYRPYDEPEFDEFGILKPKSLLSKYDEEIEGEKKASFKLGSSDEERQQELEMIRQKLRQQQGVISLDMPKATIAREYYTEEEMAKFKKPKKVRKVIRKKKPIDEQNLVASEPGTSSDYGSRKTKQSQPNSNNESMPAVGKGLPQINDEKHDDPVKMMSDDDYEGDYTEIQIEEDEAEQELRNALEKTRKLKEKELMMKKATIEKIAESVKERTQYDVEEDEEDINVYSSLWGKSNNLVLNSTAEFCKNLGDVSTWDLNEDANDEIMDFEREVPEDRKKRREFENEEEEDRGKWNEVDLDAEKSNDSESGFREGPILEEEPDVSRGLAGALKLARKKGYLDKEMKKQGSAPRHSLLQAQNYTIEEKFYDDDKQGRRERYTGPVSEFRDKDGYRPDVKLEYIDVNGRILNQKEAFRVLSHKFHGKGPGKGKIDKRMKKLEQESKLRQMVSTDTPLGTLKLLQEKQKELHSPYVILSGGPTSLTKK